MVLAELPLRRDVGGGRAAVTAAVVAVDDVTARTLHGHVLRRARLGERDDDHVGRPSVRRDERRNVLVLKLEEVADRPAGVRHRARQVRRAAVHHRAGLEAAGAAPGGDDLARVDVELLDGAREDLIGHREVARVPDRVSRIGSHLRRGGERREHAASRGDLGDLRAHEGRGLRRRAARPVPVKDDGGGLLALRSGPDLNLLAHHRDGPRGERRTRSAGRRNRRAAARRHDRAAAAAAARAGVLLGRRPGARARARSGARPRAAAAGAPAAPTGPRSGAGVVGAATVVPGRRGRAVRRPLATRSVRG